MCCRLVGNLIGWACQEDANIYHRQSSSLNVPHGKTGLFIVLIIVLLGGSGDSAADNSPTYTLPRTRSFNSCWRFTTEDVFYAYYNNTDDSQWQDVNLPHNPRYEPAVVNDQWQGRCWYRKHFSIPESDRGKKIFLRFEGAMQLAQVWLNEKAKWTQEGGYLPFVIDITDDIDYSRENVISIRLDNSSNASIPPGKQLEVLDFCYYGGLYRDVSLVVTDAIHITDAIYANKTGGGGVFAKTLHATETLALIQIKTNLVNEYKDSRSCRLRTTLFDADGRTVVQKTSHEITLGQNQDYTFEQVLEANNPNLWSPSQPSLYTVRSEIIQGDTVIDSVLTRIGIRTISYDAKEGFRINGEKLFLRGVNRHEQYPYIGNAMSNEAHYRDAKKIKDAGFDYVRLSHYPHSPAFMDACDELGLVVMDCIPGWQYMGAAKFQELCYKNSRDLIRRDRNHPCVVLWEVSLNETGMHEDYIRTTNMIAHEEYPGDQCYTCGWHGKYDVFLQARQHRIVRGPQKTSQPYLVSEYGDWEYYVDVSKPAKSYEDWTRWDEAANSRQLRRYGQKRLLSQAFNFQQAHNDNIANTPAIGDGLWIMFDYNRGYSDDLGACGVMDIFRIPKFSYYFFQSQRDADIKLANAQSGPMVYIANYWTDDSPTDVKVFSNCEEVALYLNEALVEKRQPDDDPNSSHLAHPPFTFAVRKFEPGKLKAQGYIGGSVTATDEVQTPLKPAAISIKADLSGRDLKADGVDAIFVYAYVTDENGTVVPDFSGPISFSVDGPAKLINAGTVSAEAGVAAVLLRAGTQTGQIRITAESNGLQSQPFMLDSKPLCPGEPL